MVLYIALDTRTRWHYAATHRAGLCAFTANALGYGVLLRWARARAAGEPLVFALPELIGYGRMLADWLTRQGMAVVWAPVRVVR